MLSDGVGGGLGRPDDVGRSWGGVGELFPQDLYSEKIRTCVYLSHIEKSIIYRNN